MKNIVLLCAVMAALAGCDAVSAIVSKSEQPAMVSSAGYKVQVGERVLPVWGEDSCKEVFSGPDKQNCIDLGGDKAQVLVHFKSEDSRTTTEQWKIQRDGNKVSLYTTAGEVVRDPLVK